MRRILSLVMIMVLLLTCLPVGPVSAVDPDGNTGTTDSPFGPDFDWEQSGTVIASGKCGASVSWKFDDQGTLMISGTGTMWDYDPDFLAPWYNKTVKTVIVEAGVTSVGAYAFYQCTELERVAVGKNVAVIGAGAFGFCGIMTQLVLGDGIETVEIRAFENCAALSAVTYQGARSQWNTVTVAEGNGSLRNARITCAVEDMRYSAVTAAGSSNHASFEDASAHAPDGYVRLEEDLVCDVTVSKSTYLDLNGHTLTGDVTINKGAVLSVFDSATSDYTSDSRGRIVGTITGELARSLNTPQAAYGHNYKYLTLQESDGSWSAHRYYLTVKSVILTPYMVRETYIGTGVDYRTVLKCSDLAARNITAYGTKLAGEETVYADCLTEGYVLKSGADNINEAVTRLTGVLKNTNSEAVNISNALLAPTASAYITLSDGTELESAGVTRSLRDMVVYANGATDLGRQQQYALGTLYDRFKGVLDSWTDADIANIKQYAAQFCGTDIP